MNSGAKTCYTEAEAAGCLGVSVEQLRSLVRSHFRLDGELPENAMFQASDLVVLRVLATRLPHFSVH